MAHGQRSLIPAQNEALFSQASSSLSTNPFAGSGGLHD
jgi:hypothetical protein